MRIIQFFFVLFLLSATSVQADPKVSFSPDSRTVAPGEIVSLDIVMTDFPVTEGGGVTLRFNPSVVQVTGVVLNNAAWSFAGTEGTIDNSNGSVTDILFSRFSGVSGDATIATIELKAIAKGNARLHLKESSLNPFASQGSKISVLFEPGVLFVKCSKGK